MSLPKGCNFNHPIKGRKTKVEPIRTLEDIQSIKNLLYDNPRNYAFLILGINTNLRASDLCQITVGMVRHLQPMDELEIKEKKTGKTRRISINKSCIQAIQRLLHSRDLEDDDQLFKGQRGPIGPTTIHAIIKQSCKELNLKGNYGSHTLRKTWGYHQRVTYKVGLPELMYCYNHSNQRQTLQYLCIQPEEIKEVYANEL